MSIRPTPVPLRTALDVDLLCREEPCACVAALGSFWPRSQSSFESRVAKGFKECVPTHEYEPHVSALAGFYARRVAEVLRGRRVDWVARVLGSAEREPEPERPLSLLASAVCELTGAREATPIFFRSGDRPPMRMVRHLSGAEAFRSRLRYVAQDLFIRPANLGGTVMLLDDIANTGATARVYAHALKSFAGVKRVEAVNLAITRFGRGKDGHGFLRLDTSELESEPGLRSVRVTSDGVFHLSSECSLLQGPSAIDMRFLAERSVAPCPSCCAAPASGRRWWKIW